MSAQVRLTTIQGTARSPHISAHGNHLYITWAEGTAPNTYEIWLIHSANNGDSWAAPIKIAADVSTTSPSPYVGAGQNGAYVFWTDNYQHESAGTGIYYARSIDQGASFSTPTLLIAKENTGYTRPSSVIVDTAAATERVYFSWYDSRTSGDLEIGQVFLTASCDAGSTFSTPQHVTSNDRGNDAESPRLSLSDDGSTLFLLYRSSMDGIPQEGWPPFSQRLMRSTAINCAADPVINWLHPSQQVTKGLPTEPGNTYGAALVAGSAQRLHLGYWFEGNGNNLAYRAGQPYSSGWSDPVDLTSSISGYGQNHPEHNGNPAEFNAFGFGEDTSGNLHAAIWQNGETSVDGFKVGKVLYRKGAPSGTSFTFGAEEPIVSADTAFDPRAIVNNNRLATVWADFRDNTSGAGGSELYYRHVYGEALTGKHISIGAVSMDFGRQLIHSTGAPRSVSVSITGDQQVSFSGASTTGPFIASTDCTNQSISSSCSVSISFSPTSVGNVSGTLTINSDASNAPHTVSLSGTGIDSMVEHYYYSILEREPDSGGKAFWDSEVTRMAGLGVDPKEAFIVMANYFFNSQEYLDKNASDTRFLNNLYLTFFARNADSSGLNYWLHQLQLGMPRDIVMFNFLFSGEFDSFMNGFFGNNPSRAEVLAVVDYYRGIVNRLPDTSGLNHWVGQFRTAQCANSGAVYAQAETISKEFFDSDEYLNRNRTNPEYVSDLYNAFLRRGGDLFGVNYWINELNTAARTRDEMRKTFISTTEFTIRINNIVSEGCSP